MFGDYEGITKDQFRSLSIFYSEEWLLHAVYNSLLFADFKVTKEEVEESYNRGVYYVDSSISALLEVYRYLRSKGELDLDIVDLRHLSRLFVLGALNDDEGIIKSYYKSGMSFEDFVNVMSVSSISDSIVKAFNDYYDKKPYCYDNKSALLNIVWLLIKTINSSTSNLYCKKRFGRAIIQRELALNGYYPVILEQDMIKKYKGAYLEAILYKDHRYVLNTLYSEIKKKE